MLSFQENEGPFNLTNEFLDELRKTKSVIPNDLAQYSDSKDSFSYLTALLAARNGDVIILELLLNFNLSTLHETSQQLQLKFFNYNSQRSSLLRRRHLLKTQQSILEDFYQNYGIKGMEHLDKLDVILRRTIDKMLYALIMLHRSYLRAATGTYYNGEFVILTTELRVQIHKEYSNLLAKEANEITINVLGKNFQELESLYNLLGGKIVATYYAMQFLEKENKSTKEEAHQIASKILRAQRTRERHCFELLAQLQESRDFKPSSQMKQIEKIMKLPEVNATVFNPINGNSLLHEALLNGEYFTALYLIKKGHPLLTTNFSGQRAIDAQDKHGNFLLLYLAYKKEYDLICDYILQNARANLVNHDNVGLLDVVVDNNSLLQFLLDKLSSTNYLIKHKSVLLRITALAIEIKHLLIRVHPNITVFEKILQLPSNEKSIILATLRRFKFSEHFHSRFQVDVNFAMWQHFFTLVDQQAVTGFRKWIQGISRNNSLNQLKFMEGVSLHLKESQHGESDVKLFQSLLQMLKEFNVDFQIQNLYCIYLTRFCEYADRPLNGNYLTLTKKDRRDCYLDSSYRFVSEALPEKTSRITQPMQTLPINKESYSSIFAKNESKKTNSKCVDPLQWFEKSPLSRLK